MKAEAKQALRQALRDRNEGIVPSKTSTLGPNRRITFASQQQALVFAQRYGMVESP
jgi:hypothetical protein